MHAAPVVGRVVTVLPIPSAERVRAAHVDVGTRTLVIVFGGHDVVVPGSLVPVAPPGSRVARKADRTDVKMRTRRYRGVRSHGMLCSLVELGWTHDGPDEVALLRRGEVGTALPREVVLTEWLADESLARLADYTCSSAPTHPFAESGAHAVVP